ncbi:MAG: adenylyltransferase/cytidyltransferase family protein [Flavobacteriaceae bacterium]|nr:adenylyltransferase/cytidyltransferase family protein [Flavobacteriaceae bacterium]
MNRKKVFVSGCFDMLHSGHVTFLEKANQFGDVYACIGSDNTVKEIKGRYPVITQKERKYILESIKFVKECRINKGNGNIDFVEELIDISPDIFIVNEDGNSSTKLELCNDMGIEYKVFKRIPFIGLPKRTSTDLRIKTTIPFRIDLAGGWLDQPFINQLNSGSVLTISIEPTIEFNIRSGMASSTRNKAIELWNSELPVGNPIKLAKILFSYENPPGNKVISGSQDALGILLPGLNKLFYNNGYWPNSIDSINDESILLFLEKHLFLISLGSRKNDYNVLDNIRISKEGASQLAKASDETWKAIMNKDVESFGKAFSNSFKSQINIFPNMVDDGLKKTINEYKDQCLGYKLSGAGGGGYLILVSIKPIVNSFKIKIRRKNSF